MKYNIVLANNEDLILASCPTLNKAKELLKDMFKTDDILSKIYGWKEKPKYKIIVTKGKKSFSLNVTEEEK